MKETSADTLNYQKQRLHYYRVMKLVVFKKFNYKGRTYSYNHLQPSSMFSIVTDDYSSDVVAASNIYNSSVCFISFLSIVNYKNTSLWSI